METRRNLKNFPNNKHHFIIPKNRPVTVRVSMRKTDR